MILKVGKINIRTGKDSFNKGGSLSCESYSSGLTPEQRYEWCDVNDLWDHIPDEQSLYRYLFQRLPILSSSLLAWDSILNTHSRYEFEGTETEIKKARSVIDELDVRLFLEQGIKRGGIKQLVRLFFAEMIKVGRFSYEIIPTMTADAIETIKLNDCYNDIQWIWFRDKWIPVKIDNDTGKYSSVGLQFYYFSMFQDIKNPAGRSMLRSLPMVSKIYDQMFTDMALGSHNAGHPRLHIRVNRPEKSTVETPDQYVSRAESYFDSTVENFDNLKVDDNIITWEDINIDVKTPTSPSGFVWKDNFQVAAEEIIAAVGLMPWAVGRSHGTTKNWVDTQYNFWLNRVQNFQHDAVLMANSVMDLELRLKGIQAKSNYIFDANSDPTILPKRKAESIHFETVDEMYEKGYITKDQAAQRLGLMKAEKNE